MTPRRIVLLLGAVLVVIGVIGLLVPVSISADNGSTIGCGNGLSVDTSAASNADQSNPANLPIINQVVQGTDYVGACKSAVSSRRTWTIPLVVIGVLGIAGSFFIGAGSRGGASRI
jgi:hypothetical protein